jgi:two-component system, OmpR family, sensor kinase
MEVGDPTLLRVALRNLVENARRHGGGPEGEAEIEVRVDAGGLCVADHGPGPPAELLRDGIRRFRSDERDGTGLGLSIAARIAELHGGELTLAAREGGGAVARLALPGRPLPEAEESMRGGAERPRGGAGRARLGR